MKNKTILLDRIKGLKEIPFYRTGSMSGNDAWYITTFSKEQLDLNIKEIIRLPEEEE